MVRKHRTIMVSLIIAVVCAAALVVAVTVVRRGNQSDSRMLQADYPTYSSVEQAVDAADLIVTGVPVAPSEETLQPSVTQRSNDPYANPQYGAVEGAGTQQELGVTVTVTSVRVERVLKGKAHVGDIIRVSQVGGQSDGQSVHEAHTTLLSEHELGEGDSFLLLLSAFDDGTYDAINPEIGVLEISKDGAARPLGDTSVDSQAIGTSLSEYER